MWDREDYKVEAEKQLGDENVYTDVDFKEKILQELAETSYSFFTNLNKKDYITEKDLKYFTIGFYLLPKIHKRLFNVPGRPDRESLRVKQQSRSYIKDSSDFIKKLKEIKDVPKDAIMVTTDVVGLYPSIPHDVRLEDLRIAFDDRVNKKNDAVDLIKMAKFVLKSNYFESNGKVKQ